MLRRPRGRPTAKAELGSLPGGRIFDLPLHTSRLSTCEPTIVSRKDFLQVHKQLSTILTYPISTCFRPLLNLCKNMRRYLHSYLISSARICTHTGMRCPSNRFPASGGPAAAPRGFAQPAIRARLPRGADSAAPGFFGREGIRPCHPTGKDPAKREMSGHLP